MGPGNHDPRTPAETGERSVRTWPFIALSALPCAAMLAFCGIGAHEWWLISTHQIAVIPTPAPGASSAPEVPAARLVPLILGSGVLAAAFAYAGWSGSRRALLTAWAMLAAVFLAAVVRRTLAG